MEALPLAGGQAACDRSAGRRRGVAVAFRLLAGLAWTMLAASAQADAPAPSREDTIAIAREAYLYGYPMVDGYKVLSDYTLDRTSPEFKAPFNQPGHNRRLASPDDKAVIAPNVDTPYTWTWFDLRAEPVIVTIPPFERDRYVSLQLFDTYTYIIDYVSPRTDGNAGGRYLLAGPDWRGMVPGDIRRVIRAPSELALGLLRVQVTHDGLVGVHRLQDGFTVEPLHVATRAPAPQQSPLPAPVVPINLRQAPTDLRFFAVMNWMLQVSPVLPEEAALRQRFASIGVCGGCAFAPDDERAGWIGEGMRLALQDMAQRAGRVRSSAELFGSRQVLGQDYLVRAVGAMLGIYGNAAEEFLGVGYPADSLGRAFDGRHAYRIRFAKDGFPPVGAFWSITAYDQSRLLYANPLGRHVINSSGLAGLQPDPDGGYTLYVQHARPTDAPESNWLPVPATPFTLTFRTYLPGDAVRDGRWVAPPVVRQADPAE